MRVDKEDEVVIKELTPTKVLEFKMPKRPVSKSDAWGEYSGGDYTVKISDDVVSMESDECDALYFQTKHFKQMITKLYRTMGGGE